MAENNNQASTSGSNSGVPQPEKMEKVGPVYLESYIYATELPCGHTFCFLCIKVLIRTTGCCAICCRPFPEEILNYNFIKKPLDLHEALTTTFEDGHQWFYEGDNGWWQYDQRTAQKIENARIRGERTLEILISGLMYVIDFRKMVQFEKAIPVFSKRIKRDVATIPDKKGVSGIHLLGYRAKDDQDGGMVGEPPMSDEDLMVELDDLLTRIYGPG